MMRSISFRRDGSEWTLISNDDLEDSGDSLSSAGSGDGHVHSSACSCGEHHPAEGKEEESPFGDMSPNDFSASRGTMESIDAILHEIHAPVSETEVQAYMLDSIANGAESFAEFERVHENLIRFVFTDEAQEAAYLNLLEELWELTADHYSHNLDSLKAPLRQRLLELTDRRIELSAVILEHGGSSTPPEELKDGMIHLHRSILETLSLLNRDAVLEEDEISDLELRVGDIENDFELLSEKISLWLEKRIDQKKPGEN